MTFNVSGQEVASGVQDPLAMFYVVGSILVIGVIALIGYYIYTLFK